MISGGGGGGLGVKGSYSCSCQGKGTCEMSQIGDGLTCAKGKGTCSDNCLLIISTTGVTGAAAKAKSK